MKAASRTVGKKFKLAALDCDDYSGNIFVLCSLQKTLLKFDSCTQLNLTLVRPLEGTFALVNLTFTELFHLVTVFRPFRFHNGFSGFISLNFNE